MKRLFIFILSLSLLLLLAACFDNNIDSSMDESPDDIADTIPEMNTEMNTEVNTEENKRKSLTEVVNPGESTDADGEPIEEEHGSPPRQGLNFVESSVTSANMRAFEARNAVTAEQERYLAFGAFVMTNNYESIRVFALDGSASSAGRLLRDFWSIEDREAALQQLSRLSSADGQAPVANEIYNTFVKNNYLDPLEPIDVFMIRLRGGLVNLYEASKSRAERMPDEFDRFVLLLEEDFGDVDRDEAYELFVNIIMTERINQGLEAYAGARRLLINRLGYTENELLNIPSLDAWDYGRVAIIARYGAQSGYLNEAEAWVHLKQAADSASVIYSSWREYTAAHILGRALAYGSTSEDFRDTLEFLLNHPESSFQTIDFKG